MTEEKKSTHRFGGVMTEEKKSTHRCEVVPVTLEKHPNADSLSVVTVFGYQVCVKTESWIGKTLGAYVVPDSLVDVARPEFAFLAEMPDNKGKTKIRIRAKKLRGVVSYGMLIPAPEGSKDGDDVSDQLGIERYEPPVFVDRSHNASTRAPQVPPPEVSFAIPTYDVDAFQRYAKSVFQQGEKVYVSEKIDGSNSRFLWDGTRMHIGSRNRWIEETGTSLWHKALERRPEIVELCKANPNCVLWGESFGWVQDLRYGMPQGEVDFIAFDIMKEGKWLDIQDFLDTCSKHNVPVAPSFGYHEYDFDTLMKLAEGPSTYQGAPHYREGVVVKPIKERWDHKCGRVQLKIVSLAYYEANGKEKPFK
jgi:RNA ligase (TIGR02306 family)